jgi:rifampin ADP-ribosylating transferase
MEFNPSNNVIKLCVQGMDMEGKGNAGNPTRSYRSQAPLKIVGEVTDWLRQRPEQLKEWREKLGTSRGEIIN